MLFRNKLLGQRFPLEPPSSMLDILLKRKFMYSRTITKRPGLNRTGIRGGGGTGVIYKLSATELF
jgi:hypothetical protein